jgi:hypothetical protein
MFPSFSLFSGRVNDSKIRLFRLSKSIQIMMAYTANNNKVIEVLSSSFLPIFYFSSLHFINYLFLLCFISLLIFLKIRNQQQLNFISKLENGNMALIQR